MGWRSGSMTGPTTFTFLNAKAELVSASDWDDPRHQKLWRYNLHYFDDLASRDAEERSGWHADLIARWIQDNPPGKGTGWESYPTSLRIVNWIKWGLDSQTQKSGLGEQALNSLATQTRWLSKRLEFHLLGNHLWANAKALAFAGTFFDGDESNDWLRKGVSLLERELGEQLLPDGGHFERSPMYHSIVVEDILDLINLSVAYPSRLPASFVNRLRQAAVGMLRWLRVMSHPDGQISLFNDAAFGVTPEYAQVAEYAQRVGIDVDDAPLAPIEALPDSGYVRLENDSAVVICDVAPLGPDYLPAHAHADTLSFELSVRGRRVLVNGGTGTYEPGDERERQRATPSHNAVVVDGQNSSEVWGAFRVGRRARPLGVSWTRDGETLRLTAGHDGYRRLTGRVTHTRIWRLAVGELVVRDGLSGDFETATAFFGLHPDVGVAVTDAGVSLTLGLGVKTRIELTHQPPAEIEALDSAWYPEFGLKEPRTVLAVQIETPPLVTTFRW